MTHHDDDNTNDSNDWPPKQSGRRKITDTHPELPEEEAPPSVPLQLPGGVELNALVRQAFESEQELGNIDVLRGVQDRLRERSDGKFYADGWSTTRHPPFSTFFITSLMMIAIVAIIYAVLVPLAGDPIELPRESQPVQLIPPGPE